MSAYERLPVKVLDKLSRRAHPRSSLARSNLIASFNIWQEKRGAPVEFNIYKYEEGDTDTRENYDILVKFQKDCMEAPSRSEILIADADFTLEVDCPGGCSHTFLQRKVTVGPFPSDKVHRALDRWFLNKHTKMSSRLAALPHYKIVSLRIETDDILQSRLQKGEISYKIIKCLEEWNKLTLEYKEKDQVIRRLQNQLQPCNEELSNNYEVALHSIVALNQQVMDMESRLMNDNKESTVHLLQTVDNIRQEQTDEILFCIENMGDRVIECFKSHGEPLGTRTSYSHSSPESEKNSLLEQNPELKNICSLLCKGLGDSWRELGRALKVSTRCLDDIEARYGRFGTEELVWGVLEKWAERENPTKEDLLQAVKTVGQEVILGPPMTDRHRGILKTLHAYIYTEMLDVELLLPYLRGDKILTSPQIDMILQGHGRFEKIDNLLKMLPNLGCKAFGGFVHALEYSGQIHIAKELKEAESRDPCVISNVKKGDKTLSKELSKEPGVTEIKEGAEYNDPSVVKSVELWDETLPKELPDETAVNKEKDAASKNPSLVKRAEIRNETFPQNVPDETADEIGIEEEEAVSKDPPLFKRIEIRNETLPEYVPDETAGEIGIEEEVVASKVPPLVKTGEIRHETLPLPKELPDKTTVTEIGEANSSCDVQPLGGKAVDQQIAHILRYLQQIDARASRLEGRMYVNQRVTLDRQPSSNEHT